MSDYSDIVAARDMNEIFHFFFDTWAAEYIARMPKMTSGEISLARGIQSLLSQFLSPDQRLYIVQNMCISAHTHLTVYRLYMNYRWYQTTLR